MNWPPMLMHVKIKNPKHQFGFWLPLFLIVLVAFVFVIALLPVILLVILLAWPTGWGRWMANALKTVYIMLCSLRGMKVDIQNQKETVFISVV